MLVDAAVGDRRISARRIRRCPRYVDAVQARGRARRRRVARDHRRRAARRRGLRQPAARRPLGARLPQAAERAGADAARVVRRAARDLRVACSARRYPAGELRLRVEDAAAEPSARQHLRLQHRRGARREHDAVRPRAAGRRRGRRVRARRDRRRGCRAAPPASSAPSSVNTDAIERAQVVEAFIDLPIDSAEPWRSVDAQALDRAGRRSGRADAAIDRGHRPGRRARRVPGSRRRAGRHHVMSRYETPWALNVRRASCAVVGAGAAAVRLCGVRSADRRRRRRRREAAPIAAPTRRLRPAPGHGRRTLRRERTAASRGERRWDVRGDGQGERRHVSRASASLEDVGDVGDEYNYSPPAADRRVTSADARVTGVSRVAAGPLRAALRVELELPLPLPRARTAAARADEHVPVPVTIEATLDAGSPRVAFTVTVDNRAQRSPAARALPDRRRTRRHGARRHRLRRRHPPARQRGAGDDQERSRRSAARR